MGFFLGSDEGLERRIVEKGSLSKGFGVGIRDCGIDVESRKGGMIYRRGRVRVMWCGFVFILRVVEVF